MTINESPTKTEAIDAEVEVLDLKPADKVAKIIANLREHTFGRSTIVPAIKGINKLEQSVAKGNKVNLGTLKQAIDILRHPDLRKIPVAADSLEELKDIEQFGDVSQLFTEIFSPKPEQLITTIDIIPNQRKLESQE